MAEEPSLLCQMIGNENDFEAKKGFAYENVVRILQSGETALSRQTVFINGSRAKYLKIMLAIPTLY